MKLEEFEHELALSAILFFRSPDATRNTSVPYSRTHTVKEAISYFMPEYVTIYNGSVSPKKGNFLYELFQVYMKDLREQKRVISPKRISVIKSHRNGSKYFGKRKLAELLKSQQSRGYQIDRVNSGICYLP